MSLNKERNALKALYPTSKGWARKIDKMPETQVAAIFIRFKAQGKVK